MSKEKFGALIYIMLGILFIISYFILNKNNTKILRIDLYKKVRKKNMKYYSKNLGISFLIFGISLVILGICINLNLNQIGSSIFFILFCTAIVKFIITQIKYNR